MAQFDFTPLYRSTVGFEQLPQLLQSALRGDGTEASYPPYNIEKSGPDDYRIQLALAGFERDDLDITVENNRLTVRGRMKDRDDVTWLHRGIAGRSFVRHFDLADFIRVTGAVLENGLLTIELHRELPERMRPRKIEIEAKPDPVPATNA